jgi:orotidine-5'-phosphate decarboxylase
MGLVLGIDPSLDTVPEPYRGSHNIDIVSWGKDVMDVCKGQIIGVKFQMAYFENLGIVGLSALVNLIKHARMLGLKTIMDAKRGDIGSTSEAYAQAYLSDVNAAGSSEFSCDFLTVNPLMGEDSLAPFVDMAIRYKKGLFLLLETSNPGANMILKDTLKKDITVSQKIATYIMGIHQRLHLHPTEFGPIGCVIGATNSKISHWRTILPNSLFLMPGIGAQGGNWAVVASCLTPEKKGVFVPISRGITLIKGPVKSKKEYLKSVENNIESSFKRMKNAFFKV